MRLLVLLTFALLARVESQCLTSDDDLPLQSQPDLDHITSFSIDLFHELRPPIGNFLFSPFSLWFSLVVAYLGSGGSTQGEMEEALQLTNKAETFALYKALNRGPQTNNANYTIAAANKIYIQEDIPLHECVQRVLSDEIQSLDFTQGKAAANTVNEFVKRATGGKIEEAVSPLLLEERVMLIVNAVYFKGLWEKGFAPEDTTREEFFAHPRRPGTIVDMMTQTAYFKHGFPSDVNAHILEMPYQGKRVSMFLLLPVDRNTGQELNTLFLDSKKLKSAMRDLRLGEVVVKLPKFKLENVSGRGIPLALYRMGLYELTRKGNFTSFSTDVRLRPSSYEHNAAIEVSEEGFERPAATTEGSSHGPTDNFTCNRPFMFYIYDHVVNTILFMGIYKRP